MTTPSEPVAPHQSGAPEAARLGPSELAVLDVLVDAAGRVISRHEIARRAGIADQSARRCDAIMVTLRRALGQDSIRTVRSRGWMLHREQVPHAQSLLIANRSTRTGSG